ncbi:MAG: Smr/MutS family protein [Turneriella sp.]|nr:Smr/MutS family protein [Turneriella sp.]
MRAVAQIYIRQMRYEEARSKLLAEIEKCFIAGIREVEIVHGIGSYVLRRMVEEELGKLDYVRIIKTPLANPGVLRAELLVPEENILREYL